MRKFTILLPLIMMALFVNAQIINNQNKLTVSKFHSNHKATVDNSSKDEVVIWSCDFEEETPIWTVGQDSEMPVWTVSDDAGTPTVWGNETDGWYFYHLGDTSLTRDHWAWLDLLSDIPQFGGSGQVNGNSWIQFDDIDLTGVNNPKLSFYQYYRSFNPALHSLYIELSIDNGATWTTMDVNDDLTTGDYEDLYKEVLLDPVVANENDVAIKFRWETEDISEVPVGYGWQLDDIKIINNLQYDLKLVDARMNFFAPNYVDYTEAGNEHLFHYSSYYGNIPKEQYTSSDAVSWFDVVIQNNGVDALVPNINVVVTDPEDNEVYNEVIVGAELSTGDIDTLDIIEVEFSLGTEGYPMVGTYKVTYTISADGIEDENNTDNSYESEFNITNSMMAHDLNAPNGRYGLSSYTTGGNDEEMLATDILFLYQDTVTSVDVFIDGGTDAGTSFLLHLLIYDGEAYYSLSSSDLINVEEADLDEWMNITFDDLAIIVPDAETNYINIRVAVEITYNGLENFFIGADKSENYGEFGAFGYIPNDDAWYYGFLDGGVPSIHLNCALNSIDAVEHHIANNMNVYPNPSTGVINIEGIDGANVEVINMMGQVIETIENANEFNQVDMSGYANGTYFVKVVIDNNVVTRKVNLMK